MQDDARNAFRHLLIRLVRNIDLTREQFAGSSAAMLSAYLRAEAQPMTHAQADDARQALDAALCELQKAMGELALASEMCSDMCRKLGES